MFPVNSPQRFEAPPMVYPLQMQCVSQPLQVPNPFAPVVYTSTAPSNVVLINGSPPRPPLCNQVFLPGTVQGVPQQLMPQQMVSPEPRFSPGTAPPQQLHSPAPFVNPQMPPSVPLGVPSSQPSSSGKRISSEANVSGNLNLNRGFPLPTTPYGFLDGSPQMSTCSSDTMLDGSKKEFMITRAEKVSLWRTFATVFHNGKNTELETTDNSLLAVFLGLPSHIRRAIRHLGGIGAFLKECPWFVVNGDKVELVPCMEKLYTCQDDDVTESTEKEEVKESDNAAEVPDTWEDLSISDIEEGGYFGDYVPSEPENSDSENTQKCPSQDDGNKTSTKEITGEDFLVGKKEKEKLVKEEKKPEQLVSGQREQGGKKHKEENVDDRKEEKDKSKKRSLAEREEVAHFVKDEDENVEGKCSEHHEEAFGADKSPSSNTGVFSDREVFSLDGNEAEVVKEPLTSSGSRSCQNAQQLVHQDSGGDKFASPREILRGEMVDFSVDARGDESLYIVVDEETYLSPTEIWDVSDDPDSDELKELFAKVDLAGGPCPGDSEGSGRGKESKKSKKVTWGGYKESKEGIQSPDLEFKVSSTKDAETSSSVETRDKMMQTSDNSFKCHVQTDVSGLGVDDDDEKVISGKDVSSQTLEWICQPEPQKIMVDCCVDSCDLKPLQGTVSTYTEPVLQRTVCVNTDPAEENKECSDKCKKILASCKSDLQKATLEQMETEGRLCQTVSKLKQMERECTLLKEIRGSVIADLIKGKEKPQMEEKSTSADLTFDGDALKKLQKSLSEAKVKLLHGNLKNVELQSKLALQLISQAYEESELIYTMKKMSISRKASLATQIVKYQRQLQSHREAVDDWKRKSEAFLMAGGVLEKLPLFPQIDIEKFTPEVPVRGPLRHPSQPLGGDFRLAANFTGQPVTSAAPPYQTTTGMEAAGRPVPLGGVNESKVSPMSTFTPNKKSDRPGTSMSFKGKSTCNEYSTSVSELDKGNLIENMGHGPSLKGSQLTLGNTDETMEAGTSHRKSQLFSPSETSQTLSFQDNDAQSTKAEKMSDAKPDTTLGKRDTHRQNQQGSSQPSSVDEAIIDFKLDELNTYQPSAADAYMYMQQVYASQYEYAVDPYYWFGAPLGLYNGQFPVPPTTSYGSLPPENSQTWDEDQMNKQGGDNRPGQKSPSDVGGDTSPIDLRGSDGQASLSQPTPSISPDSSPSESGINQENKPSGLQAKISQCNLPDEIKSSLDVEYATLNAQGAAGDVDGLMKTASYTGTSPLFVEPVQQDATSQPFHQSQTGSHPFIFGLPSSSESGVSHIKGEMAKDEIHKSPPGTNSLAAASQVPQKPLTLELTSFVKKNDAKQIFTDTVTSTEFQKVSIDKTTICHPNQVKSGKRMAAPVLQANIGLDDFDSLSIRSPKKKRVRGNQKEEMKTAGSGETTAEVKESQGKWIHMVGKKKKRSQEQVSQKKQQEPQVISHPGEDEHIPNYFSLTHLLRKLSEMFPNESRLSLTSIILKVRANYRGQLDKVPFAVIISEAVSLLTASDSSDEKRQNTLPAKKLEDSPEAVHQPSKPTQKGGQLTKLLKNLMERFPDKERSDLIDAIVQVRKLHGNTLGGMAMAQVLFEVTQCLQNLEGQKQMDKQNDEEKDCCTVCLAPLKATQLVRELECAHRFHDQCIQLWFEKRERTCPVCRSHALLEDEFPRLQ